MKLAGATVHEYQPEPQEGAVSWPSPLMPEALHGPVGELVGIIDPHTEADPVAILAQALVAFGNVVGRTAHFRVEADRHGMNEFVGLVGASAKARKGTSWGYVRKVFGPIDHTWADERIMGGLSSGEGLIAAVQDSSEEDAPPTDKRLLIVKGELASVLKVAKREGNILSPILRHAWDSGELRTMTKTNPLCVKGAHISLIGHITIDELLRNMDSTEAANGLANRVLWLVVKRSKLLPFGGNLDPAALDSAREPIAAAVNFARTQVDPVTLDAEARQAWIAVYGPLSEGKPGLLGAVVARAEAHALRIAALYALLDCSSVIRPEHLHAALALWRYAEESALYIFGARLGDPVGDRILAALKEAGGEGLTRTEISNALSRNYGAKEIDEALARLAGAGLALQERIATGGRPVERWRAVTA